NTKSVRGNVRYVYGVIEPHGMRYKPAGARGRARARVTRAGHLLSRNEMCTCVYMTPLYPDVVRFGMKPRVTRGQAPSSPAAATTCRTESFPGNPGVDLSQEVRRRQRAADDPRGVHDPGIDAEAGGPRSRGTGREGALVRPARLRALLP